MKVLIWLGCIFMYSSAQTMMMNSGHFDGLTAMVLAVALVFIPAPWLCKQYTKWKESRGEERTEDEPPQYETTEMGEESPMLHQDTETEKVAEEPDPPNEAESLSNIIVLDMVSPEEAKHTEPAERKSGQKSKWFVPLCVLSGILAVAVFVLGYMLIQTHSRLTTAQRQIGELNEVVNEYASIPIADNAFSYIKSTNSFTDSLEQELISANVDENATAKEKIRQWAEVLRILDRGDLPVKEDALVQSALLYRAIAPAFCVSSVNSEKYHIPSCEYAKEIQQENRVYYMTHDLAEADGKSPCSSCLKS